MTKTRSSKLARRALQKKLGRPIKPGYQANHTCDNELCVEEEHLYEGTQGDNLRDAYTRSNKGHHTYGDSQLKKTHCPKGHEYSPANTYRNNGQRLCRECRKQASRKRWKDSV